MMNVAREQINRVDGIPTSRLYRAKEIQNESLLKNIKSCSIQNWFNTIETEIGSIPLNWFNITEIKLVISFKTLVNIFVPRIRSIHSFQKFGQYI